MKNRTANFDLVHAVASLLIKDDPIEDANIMINHDSGRESSGAAVSSKKEGTQALEATDLRCSLLGTEGKATGNQLVSDQSHVKGHQRHSSMKVSSYASPDDSFSGYVETSTDREVYAQTTKRRSSASPKAKNDFVKKAFVAQKTQELNIQR